MNQVPAPVVDQQSVIGGRSAAAGRPDGERGPEVGQAERGKGVGRAEHAVGGVVGVQVLSGEDVQRRADALDPGHGVAR